MLKELCAGTASVDAGMKGSTRYILDSGVTSETSHAKDQRLFSCTVSYTVGSTCNTPVLLVNASLPPGGMPAIEFDLEFPPALALGYKQAAHLKLPSYDGAPQETAL